MTDRVGQQLGHYRLLRVLGRGAFATVYLGEHQYLERLAAIKVLRVQIEPARQESFRLEARTIARLDHPHIIGVHEFGFEDQTPYLVMEYMQGGTLRSRYSKGTQLSFEQIATYVKQIASALDYAHQQRVIHRDIKPENILLNSKGEVILSDFGLAVVEHTLDSLSTQNPAGTPFYMAPEQIRRKPCTASDQYALGVMVYEWLCGEPPFHGSLFEVFGQHLHETPPSLCARLPQLPSAVETAVFGALAKDPQQRFPTMQDFAMVLSEAFFATQLLSLHESVEYESQDQTTLPLARVVPVPVLVPSARAFDDYLRRMLGRSVTPLLVRLQRREEQQREQLPVTAWPNQDATSRQIPQELCRMLEGLGAAAHQRSDKESLNRAYLLKQVRTHWIDGLLINSLHREVLIRLGLHERSSAVTNPWSLIVHEMMRQDRPLAAGTSITTVYDRTDGQVLILGEPGAGKTTLLLELARELLTRADQDKEQRMPVVFNLSSWATKRPPFEEWLVGELHNKYYVPQAIAQAWISQEQVIPLLDGLDEVAAEYRVVCVSAINAYHRMHHLTPLVVCCRRAEYDALSTRVELQTAVMIQPLTLQQIDAYCEQIGEPIAALHQVLEQERDFQELAMTPLMLNIMTLAYQGASVNDLLQATSSKQLHQSIFAQYVERALTRRRPSPLYPKEQTLHWLSWLAQQLQSQNQTEFYIERLQPSWLPTQRLRTTYRVTSALVFGLSVGLVIGLGVSLIAWLVSGLVTGLVLGLATGLIDGLAKGLARGWQAEIRPAEIVTWSWKKTRRELACELAAGLVAGLVFGLVAGLLGGLVFGLAFGLLFGLVVGMLLIGSTHKMLNPREFITPNYGLSLSRRNGWRFGLFFGLMGALISGLISGMAVGLVSGIIVGVIAGLAIGLVGGLLFGWGAVLQQALLLAFFRHLGAIPKNYVQFLDYAAERILLRKVGGGYIFAHRLLLDFLADATEGGTEQASPSMATQPEPSLPL